MSDSLLEELVAENTYLRKKLSSLKNRTISGKFEAETYSDFTMEELADKVKISGILLAEGIWNGVLYTKNEIKKMFERFKDRLSNLRVIVEHGRDDTFKDKKVGEHKKVEWSDTLGAILYEAEITDPKAIEEIKKGRFIGTSLKLHLKKEDTGDLTKGVDLEPVDNSLTSAPACSSCIIVNTENLSNYSSSCTFKFYGININKDDLHNKGEEIEMSENNEIKKEEVEMKESNENVEEVFELKQDMVAVLPILKPREREVELEFMTAEEAIKNHRIIYGYYPAGRYPISKKKAKVTIFYYYYPVYPIYPHIGYPSYSYSYPSYTYPETTGSGYPSYYPYPYPYYYPQYPVPQYYYQPAYPTSEGEIIGPRTDKERLIAHFGKETAEKLLELIGDLAYKLLPPRGTGGSIVEGEEESEKYKIVKNNRTGKYIVMERLENGRMKILKQFDTEEEAKEYIATLSKEIVEKKTEEETVEEAENSEAKSSEAESVENKDQSENSESSNSASSENEISESKEEQKIDQETNETAAGEETTEEKAEDEKSEDEKESDQSETKQEDNAQTEQVQNEPESKDEKDVKEEEKIEAKAKDKKETNSEQSLSPAQIAKIIAEKRMIADLLITDYRRRREAQI